MKGNRASRPWALAVTAVCLLAMAGVWAAVRPQPLPMPLRIEPPGKGATSSYHVPTPATFVEDSFCAGCHGMPPHARGPFRAMLNHHATRLHCLVCHGRGFLSRTDLRLEGELLRPLPGGVPLDAAREEGWREAVLKAGPCFPAGPGCGDCHRPDGLLDLRSLGYGPQQAVRLEALEGFLTRSPADRWFFPSLP